MGIPCLVKASRAPHTSATEKMGLKTQPILRSGCGVLQNRLRGNPLERITPARTAVAAKYSDSNIDIYKAKVAPAECPNMYIRFPSMLHFARTASMIAGRKSGPSLLGSHA